MQGHNTNCGLHLYLSLGAWHLTGNENMYCVPLFRALYFQCMNQMYITWWISFRAGSDNPRSDVTKIAAFDSTPEAS